MNEPRTPVPVDEEPVSLAPLDFAEALRSLAWVEPPAEGWPEEEAENTNS